MIGVPPESEIGFTNYINMIIYLLLTWRRDIARKKRFEYLLN